MMMLRRRRGYLSSRWWCRWRVFPSLPLALIGAVLLLLLYLQVVEFVSLWHPTAATATVEAFVMVPTTSATMMRSSIHRPTTTIVARIRTTPLLPPRERFLSFAENLSSASLSSSSSSSSSANDEDTTPNIEEDNDVDEQDERFSVAPMMGHTTRHYRYFWRLFSRHATLYTEMIPSSSIVQAYQVEAEQLLGIKSTTTTIHNPDCIQEVLERLHEERLRHPERPMSTLEQLLRDDTSDGKIVLQLGGRDPHTLATAAAIGTAYRSTSATHHPTAYAYYAYSGGINLNCGCPSASVAEGRRTGAALMLEPHHVVECLNAMTNAMHSIRISSSMLLSPPLSVKHRLGVQNAHAYQQRKQQLLQTGHYSSRQEANEAYQSCQDFVSHLLASSHSSHNLSRIQVHARLALLGLDTSSSSNSDDDDDSSSQTTQPFPKLWVGDDDDDDISTTSEKKSNRNSGGGIKINHQRVQYRAKQHARQATIDNRRIPPLHPNVVSEIAKEFSSSSLLQIVTNGGMQTLDDVQRRTQPSDIHGAMVGRGAINHPCAFANVDRLLMFGRTEKEDGRCQTRRQVLERYIEYCIEQEEDFFQRRPPKTSQQTEISDLCAFRKELVAPAFHLLVGEEGNAAYQRLLKRLVSRAQRHTAAQILQAAAGQVPDESLNKPLWEHVPWTEIQDEFQERHGEAAMDTTKRSGSMQRIVF